jgi:hypothetical protein
MWCRTSLDSACSAHQRKHALTVPQAVGMPAEFPASPFAGMTSKTAIRYSSRIHFQFAPIRRVC